MFGKDMRIVYNSYTSIQFVHSFLFLPMVLM